MLSTVLVSGCYNTILVVSILSDFFLNTFKYLWNLLGIISFTILIFIKFFFSSFFFSITLAISIFFSTVDLLNFFFLFLHIFSFLYFFSFCFCHPGFICFIFYCFLYLFRYLIIFIFSVFQSISELLLWIKTQRVKSRNNSCIE